MMDRISCIHDEMTVLAVHAYTWFLSNVNTSNNGKSAKGIT